MGISHELPAHIPRLRRYARALVSRRELADDLVHDTLERALQRAEQFHAGTDLRAWLFTIMHNVFVNQTRTAMIRTPHVSMDDLRETDGALAVRSSATDGLELRDLDAALQQLPTEQREVVLLVGLEDMSYAAAANALGIPIGTVMSRLARGRQRLRALMAGTHTETRLKVVG